MRPRAYSWPEGHWDWYRHLAFKHGVRSEQFVHVGGQVDKTSRGEPLHRDDLPAQIGVVVRHIDTVLRGFGASLADTVKLTAFYAAGDGVDEAWFVAAVAEACRACGVHAPRSGPVIVPVPQPWLALPGMRVEIEAVAMLGEYGESLDRESASPDGVPELPAPFNHALRCGDHVFVGGQSAAIARVRRGQSAATGGQSAATGGQSAATGGQSAATRGQSAATGGQSAAIGGPESGALAHARLADALGKLGAARSDLVRLAAWYAAGVPPAVRAADFERDVAPLECAYVELPAPRLAPEHVVRVDGWAVCGKGSPNVERRVLRLDPPWRRPDRSAHVDGVRSGDIVFLSSQLPLDGDGAVVYRDDLNAQTRLCIERTRALLAMAGFGLDHMVKQTSYFFGDADPKDIVTNQTLRSSFYREPAGASTGVPLVDFGVMGALAAIDTIAMA